eukprot:scaffold195074_cov32-Tisochrysis_lutea.AAC.8
MQRLRDFGLVLRGRGNTDVWSVTSAGYILCPRSRQTPLEHARRPRGAAFGRIHRRALPKGSRLVAGCTQALRQSGLGGHPDEMTAVTTGEECSS